MPYRSGRHFLQIPGPTNVPDRVLRAIDKATMDHRGPEFGKLGLEILEGLKTVFQTKQPVVIFPASGTGAWEAALVNTLSPGDRVLMFETGHFASLWHKMATKLGISVDLVPTDWRRGVDPAAVEAKLKEDREHRIKAVCVVHNETSTGVTSRIGPIRRAIDAAKHPALYMVDTISSLASIDYRHDEWGVDVTVAGSQKGVMLPPGHDADALRKIILEAYDMSLGTGLGKLAGKVFRIGHLGDFNDLTLAGTLAGVEMGFALAGVPHKKGGVLAALDHLAESARAAQRKAA